MSATIILVAKWTLVVILFVAGIAGTVLPALPGTLFIFLAFLLGAWIDNFQVIETSTVIIAGVICVVAQVLDYIAGILGAKRAGASKEAIIGALIGTVAGVLSGFVGLLFFPLLGAFAGEYIAISDVRRAGNVGIATWLGMLIGAVMKLVLAFTTIGLFIFALIF
ncbi:MAG: DUF456 domain-containing protein [Burkholderiaceae bacterium]